MAAFEWHTDPPSVTVCVCAQVKEPLSSFILLFFSLIQPWISSTEAELKVMKTKETDWNVCMHWKGRNINRCMENTEFTFLLTLQLFGFFRHYSFWPFQPFEKFSFMFNGQHFKPIQPTTFQPFCLFSFFKYSSFHIFSFFTHSALYSVR